MKYNFKCFDKINGKVSEWIKFFKEFNALPVPHQVKYGNIDCSILEASSQTEKAWCFDFSNLHREGKCSKRFYYAPKSKCKLLENDYYIDEDTGKFYKGFFILLPYWIEREIGV